MKVQQKVYAFIDSQNLNLGILGLGWKLDFKRFRVYLKDKHNVSEAFLFIGNVQGNEQLYSFLQRAGYIIILKPTLQYKEKGELKTKGNVDAELVLHTMIEFKNYDKAVIVSADGDFYCLIEYLAQKDKLLHIIIPNSKKYSALLKKFGKYFVYIEQLMNKLGRKIP